MSFRKGTAGSLTVNLHGGRCIAPVKSSSLFGWRAGSANPYCVVHLFHTTHVSSVVMDSLQPRWEREQWVFEIPIPPENEISYRDKGEKSFSQYIYDPFLPELFIEVYHKSVDDLQSEDILIGEARICILPAILSENSTLNEWRTIYSSSGASVGEIRVSAQYEPVGDDPQIGDVVILAGFSGYQCYSKLIPSLDTLLVVKRIQGNRVLCSYISSEGWAVTLNILRTAILVVHHPTLVASAHNILESQLGRLKSSSSGRRILQLYDGFPNQRKNQLNQCVSFAYETGENIFNLFKGVFLTAQTNGIRDACGVLKLESVELVQNIVLDAKNRDWTGQTVSNILDSSKLQEDLKIMSSSNNIILENVDSSVKKQCPPQLLCPITSCPMSDPVVAADGHSYDRGAISRWLAFHDTSPMTGAVLPTKQLFPNHSLKQLSTQYGYDS